MNNKKANIGWFIVLPGLATWLGWGIRGQIGHANGAMIPGALAALALCHLLEGKRFSPGVAIALTAVCMGFGADETTLQSAGYVMGTNPHMGTNLARGYSGLAVKGGLWALVGGAGLGLALVYYVYSKRDIVIGALLFVAAFFFGVWAINNRRFLYFSYDRREIWGGLLLGAVALLAWMCARGRTRVPMVVALSAGATGAIGYPIAVTLATLGLHSRSTGPWNWWSLAETTFGGFIGMGLGLGTYLVMDKLPETQEPRQPATNSLSAVSVGWIVAGALASALVCALYHDGIGFPWILLGPILLCVTFCYLMAAWQAGITLVYCATAVNVSLFFLKQLKMGNPSAIWTLVAVSTLAVAWIAEAWSAKDSPGAARQAFVFMMWSILALSYLKSFVNRAIVSPPAGAVAAAGGWWGYAAHIWRSSLVVDLAFTVAALVLTGVAVGLHFNTANPSATNQPPAAAAA
jgi:hypothetical protein